MFSTELRLAGWALYFLLDQKTEPKKIKSLKRLCCECSSRYPQFSDRLPTLYNMARALYSFYFTWFYANINTE